MNASYTVLWMTGFLLHEADNLISRPDLWGNIASSVWKYYSPDKHDILYTIRPRVHRSSITLKPPA